jgi:hypothetical protein
MNKYHYQHKLAAYLLLASGITFLANNSFAKTEAPKTHPGSAIDRVTATAKHKAVTEQAKSIEGEATEIEAETQKAILALDKKDTQKATSILQSVSAKLNNLAAKNPGLDLVPASVETDLYDFVGDKKSITAAIDQAEDMLKHGKLQSARQIVAGMASEIRVSTTSIPLGTYPDAIKQILPLIDAGKIDQAIADLDSVLGTLVVITEVMPLPVLRAEELLTTAADLEHRDDLSKVAIRTEIKKLTDAAKDQLDLAQLLGYGNKADYKTLYQAVDGIDKALFTEKSITAWQKFKEEMAQFKDRSKALKEAVERAGHPAK